MTIILEVYNIYIKYNVNIFKYYIPYPIIIMLAFYHFDGTLSVAPRLLKKQLYVIRAEIGYSAVSRMMHPLLTRNQ